jgi:ATP-binding cassette subfamily B protein
MEQKRTGLSYVFTLAKEERGKLSLGMLLAVFSSALSFVPYLVVYQILLLIIKQEVTLPAMLGWAGIGIAAAVLQAILTSFAGICSHTAAFNTMHRIKVRVLEHMSKFNLGFFQEHAPGQIKTTLFDDVDRIETFLAHSTLELAQAIVVPLMMFIFMLRLNWIMALIMLVPMILGIAIPMALMGRYPDLTDEFAGDTEKLNASANEFITAMPVIKMYHLNPIIFFLFIPRLPVLCVQNTNSFMMDDVPLAAPMTHKFYNHHLPDNTNILLQNIQLVQAQGLNFQRTAI